jgi:hypothetical protein
MSSLIRKFRVSPRRSWAEVPYKGQFRMRGRDAFATAGGTVALRRKKKTGLVGPASSASSWMRGATGAEGAFLLLRRVHRSNASDQREETDRCLNANGMPCTHRFW